MNEAETYLQSHGFRRLRRLRDSSLYYRILWDGEGFQQTDFQAFDDIIQLCSRGIVSTWCKKFSKTQWAEMTVPPSDLEINSIRRWLTDKPKHLRLKVAGIRFLKSLNPRYSMPWEVVGLNQQSDILTEVSQGPCRWDVALNSSREYPIDLMVEVGNTDADKIEWLLYTYALHSRSINWVFFVIPFSTDRLVFGFCVSDKDKALEYADNKLENIVEKFKKSNIKL